MPLGIVSPTHVFQTPGAILTPHPNSPRTIPGQLVQRPTDVLPPNAWHSSSSSSPHQLALITECMHCSLRVSRVQVPNPQMETGDGVGVRVEIGQASCPLWASVSPSLKEGDGARGQAARPPTPSFLALKRWPEDSGLRGKRSEHGLSSHPQPPPWALTARKPTPTDPPREVAASTPSPLPATERQALGQTS